MPYLPNEREYRVMPILEKRTPEEGEERNEYLVEGYATTFGDPYLLFNWEGNDYYEVIDRDAIDQSTNMEDIIFQYDHDGMVYARGHNNTLSVFPDDHGLFVQADLSKTADARNMFENIASGNVYQMSWAFVVDKDEFDPETRTRHVRHIKKCFDVSAVSLPANPSTEIYPIAQQRINGAIEELRQELVERERKVKLLKILTEAK